MYFLETAIVLLVGAFLLTFFTIPKRIGVLEDKKLMDNPNHRSSHKKVTPTLGGVAFYYGLLLAIFFLKGQDMYNEAIYLVPAITILFIIGLKVDLVLLCYLT